MTTLYRHVRAARRWLALTTMVALLALVGIAGARTIPGGSGPPPIADLQPTPAPPTDPNFKDPDWGAPKRPLPKPVTGWASNQDSRKPKDFPHYGRIQIDLCDLPFEKKKGGQFNKWSDGNMRTWARGELVRQGFPMPADYTNHELVEEVDNGMGGKKKVLAVYKVWKTDHEKSGRGKLYHPRNPTNENYYGGIKQLKDLPDHLFKKTKPKKKRIGEVPGRDGLSIDQIAVECPGGICEICTSCAQTAEEAAEWCGDGDTCTLPPPDPTTTTTTTTPDTTPPPSPTPPDGGQP